MKINAFPYVISFSIKPSYGCNKVEYVVARQIRYDPFHKIYCFQRYSWIDDTLLKIDKKETNKATAIKIYSLSMIVIVGKHKKKIS